jgi:Pyruvate/2-oxoacid:ferredoxin oxidoreductase gamma subunit
MMGFTIGMTTLNNILITTIGHTDYAVSIAAGFMVEQV